MKVVSREIAAQARSQRRLVWRRGYTREQGNEPDEILRAEDFAGGDQKADQADEGLREVDAFAQVQPIDGEQASDGQQGVDRRDEADQRAADVERAESEAESEQPLFERRFGIALL